MAGSRPGRGKAQEKGRLARKVSSGGRMRVMGRGGESLLLPT